MGSSKVVDHGPWENQPRSTWSPWPAVPQRCSADHNGAIPLPRHESASASPPTAGRTLPLFTTGAQPLRDQGHRPPHGVPAPRRAPPSSRSGCLGAGFAPHLLPGVRAGDRRSWADSRRSLRYRGQGQRTLGLRQRPRPPRRRVLDLGRHPGLSGRPLGRHARRPRRLVLFGLSHRLRRRWPASSTDGCRGDDGSEQPDNRCANGRCYAVRIPARTATTPWPSPWAGQPGRRSQCACPTPLRH